MTAEAQPPAPGPAERRSADRAAERPGTGSRRPPLERLVLAATGTPREEVALEHGLLTGIAAFRWAAWTWAAIVQALDTAQDPARGRPLASAALLGAALAWTATASVLVRRPGDPARSPALDRPARSPALGRRTLLDRWALAVELAIAVPMVFLDWWTYGGDLHAQSLGTIWPLAVVLTAGVAHGTAGGLATGLLLGFVRAAGEAFFLPGLFDQSDRLLAASGSVVLYALGGAVAGFVTRKLREAERQIALARARDEVARTLHDGVLQTLAIVQRRSTDTDLVALAREQEHELREFLFTTRPDGPRPDAQADLAARLRAVSADAERRHGLRSRVVLAEDPGDVPDVIATAVSGAVGEALTNAAKHGEAQQATVYVEPGEDGGLFCSVKDDGRGFDPASTPEGVGISQSIRGRMADVGGSARISSRPGRGAEVVLQIPPGAILSRWPA
jgi:signal transduction histidine kinase